MNELYNVMEETCGFVVFPMVLVRNLAANKYYSMPDQIRRKVTQVNQILTNNDKSLIMGMGNMN